MYGAGGQKRVPEDFLADFALPLPPLPEQRAIAAFLDRETAKIDALVEKKERLLELLDEKRTTLISRAVTTGFGSNSRLQETGNPLFPVIPEGWKLVRLRRLIRQVRRPIAVDSDERYREIGLRSWGKGVFHKEAVLGRDLGDKKVFNLVPGDFVLNIVFAWEGAVGVISEAERGMIASHRFPTFKHREDQVLLEYLLTFFRSEQGRALMALHSPGAAGRNRTIRLRSLLAEEIPVPPLPVQQETLHVFLEQEKVGSELHGRSNTLIALLREYRTALISAAVTGKIDVRDEVAA